MTEQKYWWKDAKIYELYIDKFAGDIQGLTERLPYFNRLGINTLHILPHYPSPMVDDGYDVMDYQNVRPELGTLEDFRAFVARSHELGIRVITDFVLNHVSNQHPWFVEASASKDNPKRNFFLWSDTGTQLREGINCFPDLKQSNWIRNEATSDFYYATFYPQQPDLNWDNEEVVQAMLANMDFWADMGVNGFRLDAAPFLIKRDGTNCEGLPETHEVIKRIRKHLDDTYGGQVVLLAEANQTLEQTKTYFGNGDECQMCYHFPLMKAMFQTLARQDTGPVEHMIAASSDIPENCQWAVFLRNHDEITLTTLSDQEREEMLRFLDPNGAYLFNKGQATSMRLASIFAAEPERLREAFQLLYSVPGAPINYYGDELGTQNLALQEGVIDTRIYVRAPFDWQKAEQDMHDPNSLFTFVSSLTQHVAVPGMVAAEAPPEAA